MPCFYPKAYFTKFFIDFRTHGKQGHLFCPHNFTALFFQSYMPDLKPTALFLPACRRIRPRPHEALSEPPRDIILRALVPRAGEDIARVAELD